MQYQMIKNCRDLFVGSDIDNYPAELDFDIGPMMCMQYTGMCKILMFKRGDSFVEKKVVIRGDYGNYGFTTIDADVFHDDSQVIFFNFQYIISI
jgi:hypothetical protein